MDQSANRCLQRSWLVDIDHIAAPMAAELNPTWTVGFIKTGDINSLYARVRVLPLSCSPFQAAGKRFLLLADEQASGSV